LIGREAEVRAVTAAFAAGARLVTLVGPSGAGKTRLAQEVMHRFEHDARFCAVGDATDTATLVRVVAGALDAEPSIAAETLPPHLLTMRGDLLLVLDSVEHAIGSAAQLVTRMLAVAPRLRILATSLEAIGLASEHVLELGPLAIDDAVTLLREHVADARVGVVRRPARPRRASRLHSARTRARRRTLPGTLAGRPALAPRCEARRVGLAAPRRSRATP
jgi:predicted ATPase